MVLSEEKRAKLAGILTRRREMSRGAGTSSAHALASATVAPSPTPSIHVVVVPLAAAQSSPAPFPYESRVVEINSDENSTEGPISKRLRPTPAGASHSSSTGRPASLDDRTTSTPLFPNFGGRVLLRLLLPLSFPLSFSMPLKASN